MNFTYLIITSFLFISALVLFILLLQEKNKQRTNILTLEKQIVQLQTENKALLSQREDLLQEKIMLSSENRDLRDELSAKFVHLEATQLAMQNVQDTMQNQFRSIANQIIEEKTKHFDNQSNAILHPLHNEFTRLQECVQDIYLKNKNDQIDLLAELKKMQTLNASLQREAQNLTIALKGDTKKQGDWGEMILERVLESSGLEKGREYQMQASFSVEDQRQLRPDALVYLPDNKVVIIDSKVSLTAYECCISTSNEDERAEHIKSHIASIKKHIKELSDKNYAQQLDILTPEYILMFIPIESAFSIAAQHEKELFDFAWKQRVIIVTPTTLMATLSTINYVWKQVKQTQNALQIAERGGKLYDKIVGFIEDMDTLGRTLSTTQQNYNHAVQKLNQGRGNILSQAETLRDLGVKTTKTLSNTKIGKNTTNLTTE